MTDHRPEVRELMIWTRLLPAKEGFYWYRPHWNHAEPDRATIVKVVRAGDDFFVQHFGARSAGLNVKTASGEWIGPLKPAALSAPPIEPVGVREALETLLKADRELAAFKHTDSDELFEQLMDAKIAAEQQAQAALGAGEQGE